MEGEGERNQPISFRWYQSPGSFSNPPNNPDISRVTYFSIVHPRNCRHVVALGGVYESY